MLSDENQKNGQNESGKNVQYQKESIKSEKKTESDEEPQSGGYRALGREPVFKKSHNSKELSKNNEESKGELNAIKDGNPVGYRSIDRPKTEHIGAEPVSPEDDKFVKKHLKEQESDAKDGLNDSLQGVKSPFLFLFRPGFLAVIVIIISLLAFFVAGQAIQLLGAIATLPWVFRWLGWFGVWTLLLASGGALGYLIFMLLKFHTSPGFVVPGTDFIDLSNVKRNLSQCKKMKKEMEQYLQDYPLESEKDMKRLRRLGMTEDDVQHIIKSKNDVLHLEKCSEQDWLKRFNSDFLSQLDGIAFKRIKRYSLDTGIKTAAFPVTFIDAAVVLMNSYLMIGDLYRIYRLRSKPVFTLVIFGWSFFHTLAASRLGELTEEGAETLILSIEAEVESSVVNFFGSKIAPKVTEGAINGMIIRVLGRQAQRRLKPLHITSK